MMFLLKMVDYSMSFLLLNNCWVDGWVVAYRILVSAPVPFGLILGYKLGCTWLGLGLAGLGTNGSGVED